ncbi:flagellar hook-associated protein FlgL [Ammoniphilus sp. 3BR4]|uniref:flagellar hook-associated protein FlgL n=1 Tax=Ammoniphilus sp. 3BR4 TaxID=3158265 RepID=UPI0034674CF0
MNLRVTQTMLNQNMIRQVNGSYRKLESLQTQIATGKQINKPSDDPYGATRIMDYSSKIREIETFQRNTTEALNWLDMTDDMLLKANELLIRAKEIIVQGSQDSFGMQSREAVADELSQLKLNLGDIANTTYKGRFIFAGGETNRAPFDGQNLVTENLDQRMVEVTQGSYLPINVPGKELFGQDEGIFALFDQVIADLRDSSRSGAEITYHLTTLEAQQDHFVTMQSTVGARVNRVEQSIDRLAAQWTSFNKYCSDIQDTDIAKAVMELTAQENTHQAALSAGARVIQQTLVDFLR